MQKMWCGCTLEGRMRIKTFWWGAELRPESIKEWEVMTTLFTDVVDKGGYDRAFDEPPVEIVEDPELVIRINR
jgi:hypothetical protein